MSATRDRWGTAMVRLTAGALALNVVLIAGLLVLVGARGFAHFWQGGVEQLELQDGRLIMGEIRDRDVEADRVQLRVQVGNRDLSGLDFMWVDESDVQARSFPNDAALLERLEWGRFYGFPVELRRGDELLAKGSEAVWQALPSLLEQKRAERDALHALERGELDDVNYEIEQLRVDLKNADAAAAVAHEARLAVLQDRYEELVSELGEREGTLLAETLVMRAADGTPKELPVGHVVRAIRANALGASGSIALYLSRIWEFLADDPRESNTEGGIFPAIFGTVLMVFLTSLAVAPFGVMAAIYLREYAREGWAVRAVRIAMNSLAGVPSIVFGVFGLGFFVYVVGGTVDQLFYADRLPTPTYGTGGILWASLTLALLTVPVVIVSTEEGLAAVPRMVREGSLALGATKLETLLRVVLPAAAPGVMTGLILAMARAAGEVAPLMIVGMVKLAPSLPIDHHFPFVHLERKFMHLGFHIYDVGFQSPNVEAVQPLVFATALLLILVVLATNLSAILLRNRLRRRYATSAV